MYAKKNHVFLHHSCIFLPFIPPNFHIVTKCFRSEMMATYILKWVKRDTVKV